MAKSSMEKLKARKQKTKTYTLTLDEDLEAEALLELEKAETEEEKKAAEEKLEEARMELKMKAILPQEWDELLAKHPPEKDDKDSSWGEGFIPALLAVTVLGEFTEEFWTECLTSGILSPGEMASIGAAAVELNWRGINPK